MIIIIYKDSRNVSRYDLNSYRTLSGSLEYDPDMDILTANRDPTILCFLLIILTRFTIEDLLNYITGTGGYLNKNLLSFHLFWFRKRFTVFIKKSF